MAHRAETKSLDHRTIAVRTHATVLVVRLAHPSPGRRGRDDMPLAGLAAQLQAKLRAIATERGDEAGLSNPFGTVEHTPDGGHPEVQVKEWPLVHELGDSLGQRPEVNPLLEDGQQSRVRRAVAQVTVVALGQSRVEQRQPGQWRRRLRQRRGHRTIEETQIVERLLRTPAISRGRVAPVPPPLIGA